MKWISHEAVALGVGWLLGMSPEALAGVLVGSVLPDAIDQGAARLLVFRQLAFKRLHRGPSHWFGWWLALFLGAYLQTGSFSSGETAALFALGLGFGSLAHVLLDMCTEMGVPLAPWTKKNMISLKLCATGSLREYAFLAAFLLAFALIAQEDIGKLMDEARRSPLFRSLRQ